jgi:glycosyltransferase involved in cell wall biosynthesis
MMKQRKTAIYISTRPFLPIVGGREHMIEQSMSFLIEEYKLVLIIFSKDQIDSELYEKRFPGISVYRLNYPSTRNIIKNTLLRRNASLQENLFFSPMNEVEIHKLIIQYNPDVVIADMLRSFQYILHHKQTRKILEMDDLMSKRYIRFRRQKSSDLNLLGSFSDRLPASLNWMGQSMFKNIVLRLEESLIRRSENISTKYAEHITLVSEKEAAELKQRSGKQSITSIPPAFEVKGEERSGVVNKQRIELLFVGNLTTNQNLATVFYIGEELIPKLKGLGIEFSISLVGKHDDRILNMPPELKFKGFVDSLAEEYQKADIVLAPLAFGTGIKLKVIEALSWGVPVITNRIGTEGTFLQHNIHCSISEEAHEQALAIKELVNDDNLYNTLSKSGIEYVAKYHNGITLKKRYLKLLNN